MAKGKNWFHKSTDKGFDRIMKDLSRIDKAGITVGIHQEVGSYEDGPTVAYVASIQEYGTEDGRIPERPFLSTTFDDNMEQWREYGRDIVKDVIAGRRTLRTGMKRLGSIQMMEVRKTITKMKTPPNAPSTIARKGSNNPLIDTRKLRNGINYEIYGAGAVVPKAQGSK